MQTRSVCSHAIGDMESFLSDRRHSGVLREPDLGNSLGDIGRAAAKARQHSFNGLAESPLDFHGVKAWCYRGQYLRATGRQSIAGANVTLGKQHQVLADRRVSGRATAQRHSPLHEPCCQTQELQ
jgi:hypothetical protein